MPAKYGCTTCHAVDNKVVGPSFKDVAAKYRGQDVEAKLVETDLHAVVKWILSLK